MSGPAQEASFEERLFRYAELLVRHGVHLQNHQRLLVLAPLDAAPFVRLVSVAAYQAKASLVSVIYDDPELLGLRFGYAPRGSFAQHDLTRQEALNAAARRGDAVLSIHSPGLPPPAAHDPQFAASVSRAASNHAVNVTAMRRNGAIQWCSAAVPNVTWARRLFTSDSPKEALEKLWDVILRAAQADRPDPGPAWSDHTARLRARCDRLNARRFASLHITGPGTDLRVGLPAAHRWRTALRTSLRDVAYAGNVPTDEVFTLPHREQVEGWVTLSRPLMLSGRTVLNACLRFEAGRVVEARADQNSGQLAALLRRDEGSRRMGEIALVPNSSPLAKAGLVYHSSLLDENAGCHFALGNAYRFTLVGGPGMTSEAFLAAGGNESAMHVDAVFGSGLTQVDGIRDDGGAEPVMRHGEWLN